MIDQKLFRDKPEIVRNMLKNRNVEIDISKLLEIDQERRAIITELESFKMERNKISSKISEKKKVNEDISDILIKMKEISTQIDKLTTQKNQIQEKYKDQLESVPNLIHDSVPIGKDENSNIEIEKWGKKKKLENTLDHIDLSIKNNLVDIERIN